MINLSNFANLAAAISEIQDLINAHEHVLIREANFKLIAIIDYFAANGLNGTRKDVIATIEKEIGQKLLLEKLKEEGSFGSANIFYVFVEGNLTITIAPIEYKTADNLIEFLQFYK